MYNINEVMVCLDNSFKDNNLIGYTNVLSTILNPRSIYFVHVTEHPGTDISIQLKEKIELFFSNNLVSTEVIVLNGNPKEELIRLAKEKDVEMIIVGKKKNGHKNRNITEIITQKAPCSVAVVQEDIDLKIDNILLPVDFSSYSKMALEEAREVTKRLNGVKLCSLTLYEVPTGYYKVGKNYNEAAEIMKKNKEALYWRYIKKIKADDLPIEPYFKFNSTSNDAEAIYNFAIENKTDLIIIGARGKTKASTFLVGSTTGELLKLNDKIPTMVLKKKGFQFDFLNALRKI